MSISNKSQLMMNFREVTAEGEAIASDDASLDDSVLLPGKGLNRKP